MHNTDKELQSLYCFASATLLQSSVADLWHFGVIQIREYAYDKRIRIRIWIRILLFSSLTKIQQRTNFFNKVFLHITF
jgi:hypothetical protein